VKELKCASELPIGTPVFFQPIMGRGEPKYSGVTECEPWQLGHGAWVVNLCNMDPDYVYAETKGHRVNAACMQSITLDRRNRKARIDL
jgi:hypothetical protein